MTKTIWMLVGCLIFVLAAGCSSATPVQPESLPTDKHDELECLLAGTWEHVSSGDATLQKAARNAYVLEADGTGYIQANSGGQAMGVDEKLAEFEWDLDGRNLHLDRYDDQEDVFRVDDWSGAEMDWFYYNGSADYGVQRRDEAEVPDC